MKTVRRKVVDPVDIRLFGALAVGLQPAELGLRQRSSLRERILKRVRNSAPAGTFTLRAHDDEWTSLNNLVRIRVLRRDDARARLGIHRSRQAQ